jgi:hypothetical protein
MTQLAIGPDTRHLVEAHPDTELRLTCTRLGQLTRMSTSIEPGTLHQPEGHTILAIGKLNIIDGVALEGGDIIFQMWPHHEISLRGPDAGHKPDRVTYLLTIEGSFIPSDWLAQ